VKNVPNRACSASSKTATGCISAHLVLFEWRRGPRIPEEIEDQESLFPTDQIIPFGPAEALLAADLYRKLKRARGREHDIAIAACAIAHDARLWTLNPTDFKDIPKLTLV